MSPLDIAVIVPNFQRRDSLLRACRSILNQDHAASEVVVVDDGSTIDLNSVRRDLESEGVSWISLDENSGPSVARNTGVAATKSEWISFLDSDDTWMLDKLARQADWHRDNPEARISQVREQWVRDGEPVRKPDHWEPGEGDLFSASVERCSIGPSCVMIHRSLWDETGGFDSRFRVCEDYALWLDITRKESVGKIPGGPLVMKEGAREDQLSRVTPAMDRFRVVALLELLESTPLSEEQRAKVLNGLKDKCRILAGGAEKRGQRERADRYRWMAECAIRGGSLAEAIAVGWSEAESSSAVV